MKESKLYTYILVHTYINKRTNQITFKTFSVNFQNQKANLINRICWELLILLYGPLQIQRSLSNWLLLLVFKDCRSDTSVSLCVTQCFKSTQNAVPARALREPNYGDLFCLYCEKGHLEVRNTQLTKEDKIQEAGYYMQRKSPTVCTNNDCQGCRKEINLPTLPATASNID